MKKVIIVIALVVIIVVSAVEYDTYRDRQHRVQIVGVAKLLKEPCPLQYPEQKNVVVRLLGREDSVKVLRINYGKDFMAIKVSTPDGTLGYLIHDESIQVSVP